MRQCRSAHEDCLRQAPRQAAWHHSWEVWEYATAWDQRRYASWVTKDLGGGLAQVGLRMKGEGESDSQAVAVAVRVN